jgi:chemotaxis signal transduction protein
MNTSHQDEPSRQSPQTGEEPRMSLAELLALARAHTLDEQHAALEQVNSGSAPVVDPVGDPYLTFTCADVACAAPLTHFREVLPTLPTTVALPFSPPWVLGFFALHVDLIGLVDPAPFLFDSPELASISRARLYNGRVILPGETGAASTGWRLSAPESGPTALIIGTGERTLALAVGAVGDLAYVRPDEIISGQGASSLTRTPDSHFGAGVYVHPGNQAAFQVVQIDVLLDALLGAMKPGDDAS